jgi:hypothetical protein
MTPRLRTLEELAELIASLTLSHPARVAMHNLCVYSR